MILFIIVTSAPDTLLTGITIAMNIFDRRVILSLQARINILHTSPLYNHPAKHRYLARNQGNANEDEGMTLCQTNPVL